jgi:hypothetical protein
VTAVVLRWGSHSPRIVSDEKAAFGSSLKLLIYELLLLLLFNHHRKKKRYDDELA